MNNKGFTLVEVIASITILSILLMIAVPSINELNQRIRKKQMIEDGEVFKNLVKNKINGDTTIDIESGKTGYFTLKSIDSNKLTLNDYDLKSYVQVKDCEYKNDVYSCNTYKVYMKNNKYKLLNKNGTIDSGKVSDQCSGKVWCVE